MITSIGEQWFSTSDNPMGHGDPGRSTAWCEAFQLSGLSGYDAPDGFVFIVDAERTPVALVPVDLAPHFVRLLNGGRGVTP